MLRQALSLVTALALGGVAGFWLAGTQSPPAPPEKTAQTDALDRLRQALAASEQARAQLQQQVARLKLPRAVPVETVEPEVDGPDERPAKPPPEKPASGARFYRTSVEQLIAAGIPAVLATDIKARLDSWEWERLQLRDRAQREGWFNTLRYYQELFAMQRVHESLRPEIGDENYDRLLYALSYSNRVRVQDVIQFSPAEQAGLQPGDRIIEYGGQRVFSDYELNALSSEGRAGDTVLARVARDGELLDVYLPRGPIGVHTTPERVAP